MPSKLFLHEKAVDVLLAILEAEENGLKVYPLYISNLLNSPYSYISKLIAEFEKNCLLESKFEGRLRKVNLTEFGKNIAILLKNLKAELNKDFVSLSKLRIIQDLAKNMQRKDFRSLAPLIAELEIIENSTKDNEIAKEAKSLKQQLKDAIC